jgi:hypothetical protein
MHRCQGLFHPLKQFWIWFCRMAFIAAVVLLLMSSMSSKCLLFNISYIFENRKTSLGARSGEQGVCSSTAIHLLAKNSLTDSAIWADALLWCKTPKHTQTIIDVTQKETTINQQQHSCEMLICQHHQIILRFLSTATTASTHWWVHEIYC